MEDGHTLILNFTDKCFFLISELAEANSSDGGGCVVVLSDYEKEMFDAELKIQITNLQGTRFDIIA